MIIPIKWLQDYLDSSLSHREIASSFTEIGLMLDKPIKEGVLDLEHRMDRADWLSVIGCARDLSAHKNLKFSTPHLKSLNLENSQELFVDIKSSKVNRFRTRVIKNVKVGESPEFIKERLIQYGLPVINNIVDITNFVMVELGQPLHAQDIDKFYKKEIILRDSQNREKIETLDGTQVELPEGTLILSENGFPICIGGIVGGKRTGVSLETKNIVLDAGNYHQASIRSTSRKLGIFNETVLRSEKFLAPEMVDVAITRATDLILEYAGGTAYENDDAGSWKKTPKEIELTTSRLERISGEKIHPQTSIDLLKKLEYEVVEERNSGIIFKTPYFRTDIEVEDDLIADILRIRGYSQIIPEPISAFPPKDITPLSIKLNDHIKGVLVSALFHEHITDSFVKYDGHEERILLMNSLNSELDALRTSIKDNLTIVSKTYLKHGVKSGKIFEIGKVFFKTKNGDEKYLEKENLGILVFEENQNAENLSLELRKNIDLILTNLGISNYQFKPSKKHISIELNNDNKGERIGIFDGNFAEFYLDKILPHQKFHSFVLFQPENLAREDLTYSTHLLTENGEVLQFINNSHPLISKIEYLGEFLDENSRRVSFRFFTQTPSELKEIRKTIIQEAEKKFQIKFIV